MNKGNLDTLTGCGGCLLSIITFFVCLLLTAVMQFDSTVAFVLSLVVALCAFYLPIHLGEESKQQKNENIVSGYKSAGYNFTNRIKINNYLFSVDNEKKKLLIIPADYKEIILDFKNIIGFEVINDGQTVTKGSLGSPIVGGLIFGAAGAITGGIVGNKTTTDKSNISLIIQLNSFENPVIDIQILNKEMPASARELLLKELSKLIVWLKLILEQNEK